jgi:DNA-binding SARP family transcriptional activator
MRAPEGFLTPGLLGDRTRMFKAAQESSSLLSPETPEAVFDYFSKEIMEGLDAETQTFLVKTAVLPTITIAMAEQLTGLSSAHDILTRLCQSHCFAEQCHGGDPVYRYHPLFREFLLARRRQVLSPRELADVQRTAARLLEETGRTEEAFALFLQAGQVKDAIELILNHAPVLLAQGRAPTVERWLRVLPPAQLGTTPWLPFWFGSCRLYFDAVESEGLFERAFGGFEAQGDQAGKLLAACGLVESQLLSGADFRRLDPWIDRLPELLNEAASVLTPDIEARAVCAIFTAMLWRRPQYGAIAEWAARAYVLAQSPANVRHTPLIGTNLVLYYLFMGDHAKVERLLDLLRESSRSPEAPPPATIALFLAEAADAWQTGDQARCFKAVHQCLDTAKASGIVVFNAVALEAGICGALLTGDVPTAEALLREVPPTWDHSVSFKGHYYLLLAWIAMLRGHLHIAWRQIETAMSLATERYGTCLEALCHLMAAQVLHECGDKPKAAQHLACAKTIVQDLRSRHLEYVCLLTEAQFALDRGDETTGCRLLHAAMTLGRERGLVHYLGWNPSVMARLCVKALEAGIEVDYVRHLVRTGRLMPDQPPFAVESWPWPLKLTTLGPLTLTVDGEPVRFSNKVQRRPLDLLKALVAFGGYDVPVTKMLDALWPELDGDAAQRAFKITLHRLRRLVRQKDSIKLHGSRISLKPQTWYVDVWAFESLLREAEVTWSRGQKDRCAAARDRALMLYHGPFLTGDSDPWAEPVRRNLRAAFSEAILKAAEEWDAQGDPAHAAACLEQGMTLDPLAKPLYPALVKGLSRLGRRWQAHEVYRRCRLTAAECVCCCPCQEMEEALHALMTAGSSGAPPSESHA